MNDSDMVIDMNRMQKHIDHLKNHGEGECYKCADFKRYLTGIIDEVDRLGPPGTTVTTSVIAEGVFHLTVNHERH